MIGLNISKVEVIKYVGILVFGLAFGYFLFGYKSNDGAPTNTIPISGEVALQSSTQLSVEPKKVVNGVMEKTDLEVISKPVDFTVKVNGQELDIKKEENETYVLEKNKIRVNTELKGTYSLNIEPVYIDNTKHYGAGVIAGMVDSKPKVFGTLSFPVNKKNAIEGQAITNGKDFLIGIEKKF